MASAPIVVHWPFVPGGWRGTVYRGGGNEILGTAYSDTM